MSTSFNFVERRVAQALDRFPGLRRWAKRAYKRLNFLYYGSPETPIQLDERVSIQTPSDWAGVEYHGDPEFFGYYDKTPWTADQDRLLLHRMSGEKSLDLIVYQQNNTVRTWAQSRAWNLQQASMAQWIPGGTRIIFNDVVDRRLVARIVSASGDERAIPWPIQVLNPSKPEYLSLNYRRLYRLRAEYGYATSVSNFSSTTPLDQDGLWTVNYDSGAAALTISIADLVAHDPRSEMDGADHKVNHALYAPDGKRFVFMHRWLSDVGKFSRLYVCGCDGTAPRLLLDNRMVSHYSWDDETHLIAWARAPEQGDQYYRINVETGQRTAVGKGILNPYGDGHPSFSPDGRWVVTDTYPDRARNRHLLLFDRHRETLVPVGQFFAPLSYSGPERCDLHPRWSPDGRSLSIDSAHEGQRKSYILNLNQLLNEHES
jgi:WD40 repeat protein